MLFAPRGVYPTHNHHQHDLHIRNSASHTHTHTHTTHTTPPLNRTHVTSPSFVLRVNVMPCFLMEDTNVLSAMTSFFFTCDITNPP